MRWKSFERRKYIGFTGYDPETKETLFIAKTRQEYESLKRVYIDMGYKVRIKRIPLRHKKFVSGFLG